MSDSIVQKWVWSFIEGCENVPDEELCGRPSLIDDDSFTGVEEKIKVNRKLTIKTLSMHFPKISRYFMKLYLENLIFETCVLGG